ncbi:MAG: hypothetical protein N3D73_00245 [Candidatus Diapherotrites archaeon]|nr:hypothetical protein [Candidatus Diapherotrites archaeon]
MGLTDKDYFFDICRDKDSFFIPITFGKEKSSVAEMIVYIISQEGPLSIKEIYFKIKRKRSVTFQSVFKYTKILEHSGVLKKEYNKYYINLDWVDEVICFANEIKEKNCFYSNLQEKQ